MKIICVGRNYADHAKELNNDLPKKPVLFMKPKSALLLPGKFFYYPEFTDDLHYECELVIRINKNGRYISEKFAHKYYDAFTLGIDFTARDLQKEQQKAGLPWEIAKAFDASAAIGELVPLTDEVNLNNLKFRLEKNKEVVQQGDTSNMIFSVNKIVAYASEFFTLNIGDLIFTGTPAGVGPVTISDTLEGYWGDRKLLTVSIK